MDTFRFLSLGIFLILVKPSHQDAAIMCPNVQLVNPFDLKEFLGIWYEIARFHKRDLDLGSSGLTMRPSLNSCVKLVFSESDDGKLRVERTGLNKNNQTITQVGTAEQGDAEHARLFFKYSDVVEEELGVVQVDYQDHALLYGCYLTRTGHIKQDAWILGREPKLPTITLGILEGSLTSRRVDVTKFRGVSQEEYCKHAIPDNGTLVLNVDGV